MSDHGQLVRDLKYIYEKQKRRAGEKTGGAEKKRAERGEEGGGGREGEPDRAGAKQRPENRDGQCRRASAKSGGHVPHNARDT